jgi:hypothetical protein
MVVTVVAMGMVEAAIDEVIDVIAMGHRLVSAAWAMMVAVPVGTDVRGSGAAIRVVRSHLEGVFLDRTIGILVMEMTVVQVVEVVAVADRGVTASVAVLVIVIVVEMRAHDPRG